MPKVPEWNKQKEVRALIKKHKDMFGPSGIAVGKLNELLTKGPANKNQIQTYNDLAIALRKLGVKPGEALGIIEQKLNRDKEFSNTRFYWKMIRFTLYVWERVEEDERGYLKPKIDTIRKVCDDRRFKEHYYGYHPGLKFDYEKEVKLLNKLIAEKPQQQYFKEGMFKYQKSHRVIPQKHLDHILSGKK